MTIVCTPEEFLAADFAERRKFVVRQVELYPEAHNQSLVGLGDVGACGFVGCIAGWVMHLAGIYESPYRNGAQPELKRLLGLDQFDASEIYTQFDEGTALQMLLDAPVVEDEPE